MGLSIISCRSRCHFRKWNKLWPIDVKTNLLIFHSRYFEMQVSLIEKFFSSNSTDIYCQGPNNNMPALIEIISWPREGYWPLSEVVVVEVTDAFNRHKWLRTATDITGLTFTCWIVSEKSGTSTNMYLYCNLVTSKYTMIPWLPRTWRLKEPGRQ